MIKLFYIGCISLFIHTNVFGQTAHANITATITTPVGTEISNDIDTETLSKIRTTQVNDNLIQQGQNENMPFLKVIGDTFAYGVTVEDNVLLKRKEDKETFPSTQKNESFLSITVNFN